MNETLKSRIFLILSVFLAVLTLGLLAALAMKTSYQAYSSLLVRLGPEYVYEPGAGGGGGGGQQQNRDLSELFELEVDRMANQYETAQRALIEEIGEGVVEADDQGGRVGGGQAGDGAGAAGHERPVAGHAGQQGAGRGRGWLGPGVGQALPGEDEVAGGPLHLLRELHGHQRRCPKAGRQCAGNS